MRNEKLKIRCTISLNSKRVCVYCSWIQANKIHCTSTADLIKTVIHCTSIEHDEPRTWFIAQAQQTHSSRSSSIKPRTWWRTANPSKQKIKTVKPKPYESNPCEKKSIVIKWIKPSTGATNQMDLPTADQPMIHLLETQQTHQLRRSKQWNQNVNPCEKKKKIKPIKRSNPANRTDQPIHQANANQTH